MAPVLPGWNEEGVNLTEALWEQLQWPPGFSTQPLHFTPSTGQPADPAHPLSHQHSIQVGGEYPVELLAPTSTSAPAFVYPFHLTCLPPPAKDTTPLDWWNWTRAEAPVHTRGHALHFEEASRVFAKGGKVPVEFSLPANLYSQLLLSSPHLWGNVSQRAPLGLAADNTSALVQHFLYPERLLSIPDSRFLVYHRVWHQMLIVRPELRSVAASILQHHHLRRRSDVHTRMRQELARLATGLPTPDWVAAPSSLGHGYIGVQVRRQDKKTEAAPVSAERYVQEVEDILAQDELLVASFPRLNRTALPSCNAALSDTGEEPAVPQLLLLSDDPDVHLEFQQLRPCFHWIIDPAGEYYPPFIRRGDTDWNSLDSESRKEQTQKLIVELTLLSEADYVIMTMSSNLARVFAPNRGWADWAWERRMRSVDRQDWW